MADRNIISLNLAALVGGPVMAARPTLSTDGIDITSWRTNNLFSAYMAALFLSTNIATTLTAPTGALGAELWGYVAAPISQWFRAGVVNDGGDIIMLAATQGYMQQLTVVGAFSRIAIAATISGGAAPVATFVPLESYT